MLSIEIKLGKAQMKYFKWHNANPKTRYTELSPFFRHVVMLLIEPKYDTQKKKYRNDVYDDSLTESVFIQVTQETNKEKIQTDQLHFIPPGKMLILNKWIYSLIKHEVNIAVDAHLAIGAKVQDAVLSVYDLYDIEESELNYDSILKQNIRYRQNAVTFCYLPKRKK